MDGVPRRNWRFARAIGRAFLRLGGWSIEGEVPDVPRCVAIVAPHTSNWDFIWGAAAMLALDLDVRWIGKHTLFRWPLGVIMRKLGGTPVERTESAGRVSAAAAAIRDADSMLMALAPEGTRSPMRRWRTGFWHIAHEAGVPIMQAYIDYARKVVGLGPLFHTTGDLEADLAALGRFYADKVPLKPENWVVPGAAPGD